VTVSLDGFFEGSNREIGWHLVDNEFNHYAIDLLYSIDTLVFGRVTYQLMAGYWRTAQAASNNSAITGKMNSLSKIVFSKTLAKVDWNNARLAKASVVEEIAALKQQPGKNLAILGSSNLALTFIQHRLVDEFQIIVNPIVLGDGRRLFEGLCNRLDLKLIRIKNFDSGKVLLCYRP
jgi:dihydrofolate reductase